jgi:hypothetical protein
MLTPSCQTMQNLMGLMRIFIYGPLNSSVLLSLPTVSKLYLARLQSLHLLINLTQRRMLINKSWLQGALIAQLCASYVYPSLIKLVIVHSITPRLLVYLLEVLLNLGRTLYYPINVNRMNELKKEFTRSTL